MWPFDESEETRKAKSKQFEEDLEMGRYSMTWTKPELQALIQEEIEKAKEAA